VQARILRLTREKADRKNHGEDSEYPVGRGEQVQAWLRRVASASRDQSILAEEKQAKEFKAPKPMGPRAFEVVGMPLKNPGLYVVELESAILGRTPQSTPVHVRADSGPGHQPLCPLQMGRESSLVWVTTLDKGEPVKDATVSIRDCRENTL